MYAIDRKHKKIISDNTEFQHHGIMGQKWGIITRNVGVNYVPTGERASKNQVSRLMSQDKYDDLIKMHKKVVNANVATDIMLATVNPYGIYLTAKDVMKSVKYQRNMKKDDIRREELPIDSKTGFHIRTDNNPPEEDMKMINPSRIEMPWGYNNSIATALTFEMRQRGYDVRAKLIPSYMRGFDVDTAKAFDRADIQNITSSRKSGCANKTMNALDSLPNNSTGMLNLFSKNKIFATQGISYNFEKTSDGIKIYDTTKETVRTLNSINGKLNGSERVQIIRTDNAKINLQAMKEAME